MQKNSELLEASRAYRRALDNFNNADPDFFELANLELTAVRVRYETIARNMKKGSI